MRFAILTDIHANREALEAVLAETADMAIDRYAVLGDIVGYGPDPGWCIDKVADLQAAGALCVRGNHDRAVGVPDGALNDNARRVIDWTVDRLSVPHKRFLDSLPMAIEEEGVFFVHASAYAPDDWHYVTNETIADQSLGATHAPLTLCGHVHRAALYSRDLAGRTAGHAVPFGVGLPLLRSRRWLAVVGSVGQPRDGSGLASFAILDKSANELTFRRVGYDSATTARKVRSAGLPETLAARLVLGV